uniref:Uncharacterized protein n=1 Tax=Oryza punctata TaxID=4537 RepID=A0A0E0LF80_ORYPU
MDMYLRMCIRKKFFRLNTKKILCRTLPASASMVCWSDMVVDAASQPFAWLISYCAFLSSAVLLLVASYKVIKLYDGGIGSIKWLWSASLDSCGDRYLSTGRTRESAALCRLNVDLCYWHCLACWIRACIDASLALICIAVLVLASISITSSISGVCCCDLISSEHSTNVPHCMCDQIVDVIPKFVQKVPGLIRIY